MIGTFKVEHIRDGKVIQSFECNNQIVTEGKQELVQLKSNKGSRSFVMNPGSGEFELIIHGENPFGWLQSVTVVTFPEPITMTIGDELRIDFPEFMRACGESICDLCGKAYFDHPYSDAHRDYLDRPFIKQLCDGRLVKL